MRIDHPIVSSHTSQVSVRDLSRCSTREARACLAFEKASALHALPLGFLEQYGEKILTLAVEKQSPEIVQHLRFATGCAVRLVEVHPSLLQRAIFIAYHSDETRIESAIAALDNKKGDRKINSEKLFGLRAATSPENNLFCSIIDYAISVEASDVHLIPKEKGGFVQLRVGGSFHSRETRMCSPDSFAKIIQRIKVLSRLDISVHSKPQDGSFQVPLIDGVISIRVSIMPTYYGEKAVLRLLQSDRGLSLDALNYPESVIRHIEGAMSLPSGLTLFCGATGSGKTTSLYSVMKACSHHSKSIVSIEDPIESLFDWMDQTQLSEQGGLSSSEALRALLRQDPDVIMIGEIRDEATAQTAMRAAMTGHKIFSSLHAGDIEQAILRLRAFGIDPHSIAATVNVIVQQELIPKLCPACRCIDLDGFRRYGVQVHKSAGCSLCDGTGFVGRIPMVESLAMYDLEHAMRMQICDTTCSSEVDLRARYTRRDSIEHLLKQGLISAVQFENLLHR